MIQNIIDGVITQLKTVFPLVPRIYTEEVKQGFQTPCFMVRALNPTSKQFLGERYYRTNLISVQYVPASKNDSKAECYAVNDQLFQALEYIKLGDDLLRGTKMNAEYANSVLNFFVNYNLFVRSVQERFPMETLTIENKTG